MTSLHENAGRLNPLETAFGQLAEKKKLLGEIEKKLKVAEEGKLREIVGTQSKLASEKTVRESIEAIAGRIHKRMGPYRAFKRDFDQIMTTAGTCTEDEASQKTMVAINAVFLKNNEAVKQKERELNAMLKSCAKELTKLAGELKVQAISA